MLDTEGTPATADKPGNHDRATAAATVAIVGVLSTVLRIRIRALGSRVFFYDPWIRDPDWVKIRIRFRYPDLG
jgi:hypothetical protein